MRGMLIGLGFAVAAAALAQGASVDWTPAERAGIEKALHAINMTPDDLKYNKRPFNDKWRLPCVNECLDDPLTVPSVVERMRRALTNKPTPASVCWPLPEVGGFKHGATPISPPLAVERGDLHGKPWRYQGSSGYLTQIPKPLRAPVQHLLATLASTDDMLASTTPDLSVMERRELLRSLPYLALEEDTPSLKFSFLVPGAKPSDTERTWKLLDKVDVHQIILAADYLYKQVPGLVYEFMKARNHVTNWKKKVVLDTEYGKVVIAGFANDWHQYGEHVAAIVDLGGDDTYVGEVASGIGRASLVLDLGGNDRYELSDLSGGAGFLGVGLLYDAAGDDVYSGGHFSLGAGLAGVGILIDKSGNDTYRGKAFTEGAAAFGLGWLDDEKGTDYYDAWFFAQGAAATMGVGLLSDFAGNDVYHAGGWLMNAPLLEAQKVHYSFAQGFATGFREDTGGRSGGFGMLYDQAGDDAYWGESYAQGASYWFAFGALLDMSGHDSYDSYYYSQASAMHLTVATLMDMSGDDSYSCKLGAMHGIGHDYGVALLFDRAGNDVYAGAGTTPGVGNANGVGIFVDSAGNDHYQNPGGIGNESRGTGSVGIFVDLAGKDQYYGAFADGSLEKHGKWGVAMDVADPPSVAAQAAAPPPPHPKPGSIANPGDAALEKLYKDATLWEVGTAREAVRKARNQLVGIGLPACKFMVDKHLGDTNRLADRAFIEVIGAVGPEAQQLLIAHLDDPNDETAKNVLRFLSDMHATGLGPKLSTLMDRKGFTKSVIRAAGSLGEATLVPRLTSLLSDTDPTVGLESAIALGQIADPAACDGLVAALSNKGLPLRESAAASLVKIGPPSIPKVLPLLDQQDTVVLRVALEVLRKLRAPEAGKPAVRLMTHSDWGVRLDAAETLFAIGKGNLAVAFMEREPEPAVRQRVRALQTEAR